MIKSLYILAPSSLQEKPSPSDEGKGFSDNISSDSSKQVSIASTIFGQ